MKRRSDGKTGRRGGGSSGDVATMKAGRKAMGVSRRQFLKGATVAAVAAAGPWVRLRRSFALDQVRMACWSPRLSEQANVFVAEEKGFFRDEGIEMKWVPGLGSGDALKNMLAGNADIAFVGPEAIYFAADKGSRLKVVYNIYPLNCFNVFALKKHNIIIPEDLRGKKVGIIGMGSGTRYNLDTVLGVHGMTERDVELVAVGLNAAPAILTDKVHAMASTDTLLWGMQHGGLGPVDVIWVRDYLNLPSDVFTVQEGYFGSRRDVVKRFLKAYRRGTEWTIKNPDAAVPITQKYAIDGQDPVKVLVNIKMRVIRTSQNDTTRKKGLGWFDLPILEEGVRVYKKAGFVKNDIDIKNIVTNEIVAEL